MQRETYFNRLGTLGVCLANVRSFQSTLKTSMIDTTAGIVAQFNSEPDLQAEIGDTYISTLSGLEGICSIVQKLAQDATNRAVFRDNALLNQNLTQGNTLASINEVIRQMGIAGATVLAQTITAVPATFPSNGLFFINPEFSINPGNYVPVMSIKRPLDGRVLENTFAETLTFTCTADSYTGGATQFNEPFSLTGQGNESDLFAFDWPLGSNCSTGLNSINGDANNSQGNLLTNSGFFAWNAANTIPTSFTVVAGGSIISRSQSIIFSTGSALLITGDGATKPQITQNWTANAKAQTQYAFNIWMRRGGSVVSTGILTVSLTDQNGNTINDNNGVPNSTTFDLTTLTTSWRPFNVAFRLPNIIPTTININLQVTTATNSGSQVYWDKSALGVMTQAYVGGPFASLFAGNVPAALNDYNFTTTTNSRGAAGTLATWQTCLFQLYDPIAAQNEIIWPSSSTPNISDGLL